VSSKCAWPVAVVFAGAPQHEVRQHISANPSVERRQARGVHSAGGPVVQLLVVNAAAEPKLMRALDPVKVLVDRPQGPFMRYSWGRPPAADRKRRVVCR